MFGNIINNTQIVSLIDRGVIKIEPFDPKMLRTLHYPLTAAGVLHIEGRDPNGQPKLRKVHDFEHDGEVYALQPNEFCLVEVDEYVALEDGVTAQFQPNSTLITCGFDLVAGKLDEGYGMQAGRKQKLYFGLKNLLDQPNDLSVDMGLAWIYFVDTRGLNTSNFDLSDRDLREWLSRFPRFKHANDDGVHYD